MTPLEKRCEYLNELGKREYPELELEFRSKANQPRVVVAYIDLSDTVAFGISEVGGDRDVGFEGEFKERVNEALLRISKKVLNSISE